MKTAAELGLTRCSVCGTLNPVHRQRCSRCDGSLQQRRRHSLSHGWALMLAAVILYLPANLLPVMTVTSLGQSEPSTILGGVMLLLHEGMWPLALLIFVASIFLPLLKLGILAGLLISTQRRSTRRPLERLQLYRLSEFVGRWSMVDVFVVAILAALVQLGNLATIHGNLGTSLFATVVALTMLAVESFDQRLIWDPIQKNEHE
ncbi:MAG: paraquat-inducible protein A [Gammaproteobacteria bacterium]|nr:paraquat-inducible protein A [Gammaproteobacteria bacterium]MBU1653862.1 paraquat-inducible protein A [Gammaproteobacteria bacterium]MBU1960411.1 paraquat-inducible protein A [Gammaproteobacteria bacterium]